MLCAGAPDTPEIAAEIAGKVERLRATRGNVIWIEQMLAKPEVIQFLSHATVFVCPSIYEPLGIVNLEAMACEAAVVATRTGGIPEVVDDGVTGLLVPFEPRDDGSREPVDPAGFARAIAERVNALLADRPRAERFGKAGRRRAVERFSWPAIAARDGGALRAPALKIEPRSTVIARQPLVHHDRSSALLGVAVLLGVADQADDEPEREHDHHRERPTEEHVDERAHAGSRSTSARVSLA